MPIQTASLGKPEPDPLVAGRLSTGDYKRPFTNKQHPHVVVSFIVFSNMGKIL